MHENVEELSWNFIIPGPKNQTENEVKSLRFVLRKPPSMNNKVKIIYICVLPTLTYYLGMKRVCTITYEEENRIVMIQNVLERSVYLEWK